MTDIIVCSNVIVVINCATSGMFFFIIIVVWSHRKFGKPWSICNKPKLIDIFIIDIRYYNYNRYFSSQLQGFLGPELTRLHPEIFINSL